MANTLARMERDGLVTRRPDESDGRRRRVWLTDHARQLEAGATAAARAQNDLALAALSEQERATLQALLRKSILTFPRT